MTRREWTVRDRRRRYVAAPLAATIVLAALCGGAPLETALVGLITFVAAAALIPAVAVARLLPSVGLLLAFARAALGGIALAALSLAVGFPDGSPVVFVAASLAAAIAAVIPFVPMRYAGAPLRPIRVGIIGSPASATLLRIELGRTGNSRYDLVGRIAFDDDHEVSYGPDTLGELGSLRQTVEEHDLELLLLAGEAPRLRVFDEVANTCMDMSVRLLQLSAFYETAFGHVPVSDINSAWFQYFLHPEYTTKMSRGKRAFDVVVASVLGVAFAPILLIAALLVKRDGGPALFKQERIGEGGQPFTMYKLRTMTPGNHSAWTVADDPRLTPIGRLLRRTHIDELPQIWNVLRGDMTIVGPRPEQPSFVTRLEQVIPYYERRHLIKPGIAGWAQIRCGYAGSEIGSAWKLCHDLYYVKRRSFGMDLAILFETARLLFVEHQWSVEPSAALGMQPERSTAALIEAVSA